MYGVSWSSFNIQAILRVVACISASIGFDPVKEEKKMNLRPVLNLNEGQTFFHEEGKKFFQLKKTT